ncbi:AAA family ATPase [Streptomyces sp. TLI_171]|uniref:AAA family ATPase n=1 Tax=Streptomyces sp. TLI_171 TaxID=1938859 RepID=UPI000C1793A8|nr:AAA family ATPase [Streptomyces sp. TLI_171]RKE02926.1 putative kinase [Streptomyces sp. TLI_171]
MPVTLLPTLDPVPEGALVLMIGPPASGKTTLLREVPAHEVVSLDRLRAAVSRPGDQTATADALLLQQQILTMRLRRGETTYVDNCSLTPSHREQLTWLARQFARPTVAVLVDAPFDQLVLRNYARPDHARVPEDFLRAAHRLGRDARQQLADEGFGEIRHHRTGN